MCYYMSSDCTMYYQEKNGYKESLFEDVKHIFKGNNAYSPDDIDVRRFYSIPQKNSALDEWILIPLGLKKKYDPWRGTL